MPFEFTKTPKHGVSAKELEDVFDKDAHVAGVEVVGTPSDGDVIQYDATKKAWELNAVQATGTASGPFEIEADDGTGDVSQIERNGKALKTYLQGQNSNLSVEVQSDPNLSAAEDGVSIYGENGGSPVKVAVSSSGALQTDASFSSVELEADDGTGTVSNIQRNSSSLKTYLTGQENDVDVNLSSNSLASSVGVLVDNQPISIDLSSQSITRLSSTLSLDNGSGTYGEIHRTDNSVHTYFHGQDKNIDVDIERFAPTFNPSSDGIAVFGDNNGSNVQLNVDSNGTLQTSGEGGATGPFQIEADDGTGSVSQIEREAAALKTYISGQTSNLSVDVESDQNLSAGSDAVSVYGNSSGSQVQIQVDSNGVVQTNTNEVFQIEADNGTGNVSKIQRNGTSLETYVTGQASNLSVDLKTDNAGLLTETRFEDALNANDKVQTAIGQVKGKVSTSEPTAVSDGNLIDLYLSEHGRLHVLNDRNLSETEDNVTVYGSDGSTKKILKTDANGVLQTDASVSVGSVELEADDGTGTVSPIERNGTSLQTFLTGQSSNLSVDVQSNPDLSATSDSVKIEGDNSGSATPVSVDSTGAVETTVKGETQTKRASSQTFRASSLTNSVVQVKGSAGTLLNYHMTNTNTNFVYVKIYDATGAELGVTSPALDLGIPPETGVTMQTTSAEFSNGIEIAVATGSGDNANSAPTSSITANIIYR